MSSCQIVLLLLSAEEAVVCAELQLLLWERVHIDETRATFSETRAAHVICAPVCLASRSSFPPT